MFTSEAAGICIVFQKLDVWELFSKFPKYDMQEGIGIRDFSTESKDGDLASHLLSAAYCPTEIQRLAGFLTLCSQYITTICFAIEWNVAFVILRAPFEAGTPHDKHIGISGSL